MGARNVGAVVKRLEDPRLTTGRGRYTDDIVLPGLLELERRGDQRPLVAKRARLRAPGDLAAPGSRDAEGALSGEPAAAYNSLA
jgi:CO/xanthine dehydrogenase Mo-binding subunit